LTTDGWSNILGEPVVNYCAVTPIQTFFLEAISTETDGHTAEFIAGDIKRVIEGNPSLKDRIVGCCTDNTAANQSAWSKLKEVYPDKYFYGCVCHVLHLLVHDIVREVKWMSALQVTCQDFVRTIKKSGLLHAEMKARLKAANLNEFVVVGETRWGSILKCFERMKQNLTVVLDFVETESFLDMKTKDKKEARANMKKALMQNDVRENLNKAISILKPICDQIVAFQGEHIPRHVN
jgi:hypothetical protein